MNIEIESLVFFDAAQVEVRMLGQDAATERRKLAAFLVNAAEGVADLLERWDGIDEAKVREKALEVAVLACRVVMSGMKE